MSNSKNLLLIGPPNSGKTTLFNWMTGYKRKTVNFPGSTVEMALAPIKNPGSEFKPASPDQKKKVFTNDISSYQVMDTPGIYSFFSASEERECILNLLKDSVGKKALSGVILVLDVTRLKRQLHLYFQIQALNIPVVLALTMCDIQKKQGGVNAGELSRRLKVPVYPIEGLLGGGVKELLSGVQNGFKKAATSINLPALKGEMKEKQLDFLKKAEGVADSVFKTSKRSVSWSSHKVDNFLLHPVFGFSFLSVILFMFFSSIFWLASPIMDVLDVGISYLADWVLSVKPAGSVGSDFLANGVITGIGSFLVFVPQVYILFVGIDLLEDSGYLARAVALVDGPFSKLGLSGRSLIPFLSGFACAIPATIAARGIGSKRERWITIFVLPFMTCSARIPVYALLLSFLFYGDSVWKPALCMSIIYLVSLFLGLGAAGLLNVLIKKDSKHVPLLMELPLYRRPMLLNVISTSWSKTRHFILKAGPVIFTFSILMWAVTHFPRNHDLSPDQQVKQSYLGQFGSWIEPASESIGGDWRVGVSLLSAFVAREVFVSVLAVVLKNTESEDSEGGLISSMTNTMRETKRGGVDGSLLFSIKSVIALLIFFMLSLQCLSTTAVVLKESGSWGLALSQLVSLNLAGYLGAFAVYNFF